MTCVVPSQRVYLRHHWVLDDVTVHGNPATLAVTRRCVRCQISHTVTGEAPNGYIDALLDHVTRERQYVTVTRSDREEAAVSDCTGCTRHRVRLGCPRHGVDVSGALRV